MSGLKNLRQITETGRSYSIFNSDMTEELVCDIDDLKTARKLQKERGGIIKRCAWADYDDGNYSEFAYGDTFQEAERKLRQGDLGF